MKGGIITIALFFWLGTAVVNSVPAENVMQQQVVVGNITNGLLMGIFVLLVGLLLKEDRKEK